MTSILTRLTMLSDWHVGTGTGRRGYADRLVKRDASGLPFIPAKTMTGVWRDACEIAAHALDGAAAGPWHSWTEHLFGSQPALSEARTAQAGDGRPREAALSVRSLHYPRDVAVALTGKPQLAAAVTFLKPGVKIGIATGAAADRLLRFDEMARCGAVLTGSAEIDGYAELDGDQQRCTAALLMAGARLVDAIGAKRRRGTGRCRLELNGIAADLDWLAAVGVPPLPPPHDPPAEASPWALPVSRRPPSAWDIAELRIELRTPVVVHERTVGNAVRSMDYVPGSVLLPGVLHRLASAARSGHSDDISAAARGGDLIVTNATVEADGTPGRPTPRFLARHRGTGAYSPLCNRAAQRAPEWFHPEPVTEGYLPARSGAPPAILTVARTEQAHNTIEDSVQRPTEAVGGLYMYQAISAGTVLRAEVRAPAGLLQPGWPQRLDGEWRIGRSSKDDYGLADVTAGTRTWSPDPAPSLSAGDPGQLRVWLLSDLLTTDERLRPSTDPGDVARVLGKSLGARLTPAGRRADGLAVASTDDRRTESWQRRWGLPRSSLIGMSAGSCLTFDIDGPHPSATAIRRVELTGVGLRRGEGFGQMRIDDPLLYTTFGADRPADTGARAPRPPATTAGQADPDGSQQASTVQSDALRSPSLRVIEEAAWRQAITERSESKAATTAGRREVLGDRFAAVKPSQLASLRMIASAPGDEPSGRAEHWLGRLTASKGRERSWPPEVRERIASLLTDPATVWSILALPETDLSSSPSAARELRQRLWGEAVRVLVADCLTAHRRSSPEARDA